MPKRKSVCVGVISRIDYLSRGFRKGLLALSLEAFRFWSPEFIVLQGGFVSYPDYRRALQARIQDALLQWKAQPRGEREKRDEVVVRATEEFKEEVADGLAGAIPHFAGKDGRPIDLFVVASPAVNYDGPVGSDIAYRLSLRRNDIEFWGEEDERFQLGGIHRPDGEEKVLWSVLPTKAAWRSKYYSTRPDRLVEDKEAQTSQDLPDAWLSDCSAVSLFRPLGELSRPRVAVPGLHRLQEVTTSENQVGIALIEFFADRENPDVWTFSCKDLTSRERLFVPDPKGISNLQRAILERLRKHPHRIGMLHRTLPRRKRTSIERAIQRYNASGLEPPVAFDEARKKYDFDSAWLQEKLVYPAPDIASLAVDRLAAFGCLHAGYRTTQYRWFAHRFPEFVVEHGSRYLLGLGDYVAGLKHNLHLRGEIFGGLTNTEQQRVAAYLIGHVMFRAAELNFEKMCSRKKCEIDEARAAALLDAALPIFLYREGNHDKWLLEQGIDPLSEIELRLVDYLEEKIAAFLRERGFSHPDLRGTVKSHVRYGYEHVLPSGIVLGLHHPEMARAQTASLRPQQVLAQQRRCHVCAYANFHTSKRVEEWRSPLGHRVALEVGSMVSGTDFEYGKLKVVDTHVGFLDVYSADARIVMTKTSFEGPSKDEMEALDKDSSFQRILGHIGI